MYQAFQSESTECGLACIAIALDIYGAPVDLAELRRKHHVSSRGLTLKEVVDIAAANGLVGRAVRCDLDELRELRCPAILHWGLHHYVVLERVKGKTVRISDPASGRSDLGMDEVSRFFTGVALELAPAPGFRRRRQKSPLSLWSWFRLEPAMYGSLLQILLLSLLLQVYVVASPFYMQLAIDQAALKGDHGLLMSLALGFGLFGLFNVCAEGLRGVVTLRLSALLNWDMTLRLFRHMVRLPLPWFQRRKLADVLSRFDAIAPVRELISGTLVATAVDGLLAVVTLVMMYVLAPRLANVVLAALVLYMALRMAMLPISIRLGMEALGARIAESGKRIETVRAIQTLKVMGAENTREGDWANKFAATIKREQSVNVANLSFTSIHGLLDASVNVILVYMGARAVMDSSMTVGLLYAFMAYHTQFSNRASALFDQIIHWRLTDMYSYRLADIVLTPKEDRIDEISVAQPHIQGALEFNGIGFAYAPQEPPILRDVSFVIEPGEFVAIVGPSGAGKSTLLKVLCGLYPASAGQVLLDGRSLESWGPKATRRALGVVMQDDELLAGTIAENVAFFDEQIDIHRVWTCLEQAAIAQDILKMPMRVETFIGEMGATLSGGQKQRILLARALYREPRILVLDEATSHLDMRRESEINAALKALTITRVIVAHRSETIAAADRIITIDRGTVVCDHRNPARQLVELAGDEAPPPA
ncbi:ATP-binding cassette domain-containing protein [Rugamonas sp. FT107W]|uniref:Cyclolysin secretion/processing ATP-binding protein CyaB n=1 Tax=Duganella vulcania TaxID=2692166 RepID=A0A845H9D9_9BURK|nr:peptidase domain-containing ABC transporter [Duganella vulcania]MYN15361.1 ATP-binding cassette domain-containing protein [Duganella vulcania]